MQSIPVIPWHVVAQFAAGIAFIALAAVAGAYLCSFCYRQRGDVSSPGGTQAARLEAWSVPVGAFVAVLSALSAPIPVALAVGVTTVLTALAGLLLLPHGAFHGLGKDYRPNKWPLRLMQALGIPYTYGTCVVGLALFGVGRIALLLAPAAALPAVFGNVAHPWLFSLSAFGVLHAVAYIVGRATGPWSHPLISFETEIGEWLWGGAQGAVVGGGLAAVAVSF